jgi:hypothetical protein
MGRIGRGRNRTTLPGAEPDGSPSARTTSAVRPESGRPNEGRRDEHPISDQESCRCPADGGRGERRDDRDVDRFDYWRARGRGSRSRQPTRSCQPPGARQPTGTPGPRESARTCQPAGPSRPRQPTRTYDAARSARKREASNSRQRREPARSEHRTRWPGSRRTVARHSSEPAHQDPPGAAALRLTQRRFVADQRLHCELVG